MKNKLKSVSKYTSVFLAGAIFATAGSAYGAEAIKTIKAKLRPDIKVSVNGKPLDASAITYNNTTYLPLRKAAEAVNGKIELNGSNINIVTEAPNNSSTTQPTNTGNQNNSQSNTQNDIIFIDSVELSLQVTKDEVELFHTRVKDGIIVASFNEKEYTIEKYDSFYYKETGRTYYSKKFLLQFYTEAYLSKFTRYTVNFEKNNLIKH
ncbi:stalk domain-containing protein [Cohnella boryungensis]|uniref:Stalk domain-containing protein n=1 Tax=Cohnella boryungensis TaxID=768479 RepID=A0ABV8SAR2_9BACL